MFVGRESYLSGYTHHCCCVIKFLFNIEVDKQNSYFYEFITLSTSLIALILPPFLVPSALQHSFFGKASLDLFFRTLYPSDGAPVFLSADNS